MGPRRGRGRGRDRLSGKPPWVDATNATVCLIGPEHVQEQCQIIGDLVLMLSTQERGAQWMISGSGASSSITVANSINTTLSPNWFNCTVLATLRWALARTSARNLPHNPCPAPLSHALHFDYDRQIRGTKEA